VLGAALRRCSTSSRAANPEADPLTAHVLHLIQGDGAMRGRFAAGSGHAINWGGAAASSPVRPFAAPHPTSEYGGKRLFAALRTDVRSAGEPRSITAGRMISGEVLKWRNGLGLVVLSGWVGRSPGSNRFSLTGPLRRLRSEAERRT